MYRFLDRPVASLAPGEQILLWSMRGWVTAMATRQCPARALGPFFERWRLADILPDFNMAMALLNCEGQERLHFCGQQCPQANDDEARLLAMFHAAAADDYRVLRPLVDLTLKPQAVPPFLAAIGQAADMLRRTPVPRAS
ncbi:hypothetical protein [Sphingomonas hengshuiensis]|uniref:hypothetical protein n=1 Tax=Sphingomonas hengshuiensis TaxID=1609977 RepID=UPI000695D959|nr:hypothetical protein [Sphingomonas hengshuiensis]